MGVVQDIEMATSANFTCEMLVSFGDLELYRKSCYVIFDRTSLPFSEANETCQEICPKFNSKTPNYWEFHELNHNSLIEQIAKKSIDLTGKASG